MGKLKAFLRTLYLNKYNKGIRSRYENGLSLYVKAGNEEKERELVNRAVFYTNKEISVKRIRNAWDFFSTFYFDEKVKLIGDTNIIYNFFNYFYNVDYEVNYLDGWEWHKLLSKHEKTTDSNTANEKRFFSYVDSLPEHNKVYLFGTGPSLANAFNIDTSDGYKIVCNTIVRDKSLWHHLKPHIIVAGDAIYHFGHTEFAKSFRKDLLERLKETPDTLFIYPDLFHSFLKKDLCEIENQLLPIPIGQDINIQSLKQSFQLPALGNVLNLLLLPVGVSLAKNISLLGFDGRAPDDKLFWSNSSKHSYPEHFEDLKESHPKFFEHFVPKENPNQYVKEVHGDVLEQNLSRLENEGFNISMLAPSWTETLNKRFKKKKC